MSFVLPQYPAELPIAARFRLFGRCQNCWRVASTELPVPAAESAPCDVDELLESEFLKTVRFTCDQCESAIFSLIGASSLTAAEEEGWTDAGPDL